MHARFWIRRAKRMISVPCARIMSYLLADAHQTNLDLVKRNKSRFASRAHLVCQTSTKALSILIHHPY